MNVIDGRALRMTGHESADVVIIGSGPAGAAVARTVTRAGASVIVLEEGPLVRPDEFPEDGFRAMARLYRDMGTSITMGRAPMPYIQGRAVGGTSVVNGAISWRLPQDVYASWVDDDPALGDALPWSELSATMDAIERDLSIAPTADDIAGPHNLAMARGAEALGLAHRPISRNVRACRGLGRCLQGCPEGRKMSMEQTYLPDAVARGARIFSDVRATRILHERGQATAVLARTQGGASLQLEARHAVVLAASAVQTPLLLLASGLGHGPVGQRFQCHPGVSVAGRFREEMKLWTGATQGHEVTGLRHEGLKLEVLGYDMAVAAGRLKSIGAGLSRDVGELGHWANWGAAVRARTFGRVSRGLLGRPFVSFSLGERDLRIVRRGVRMLGEVMLAAGAQYVTPGVHGWHQKVSDPAVMARFEDEGPRDARAYMMAVTHLFGTARMGSDARTAVVRPDFRHHTTGRLYVADSSVFPTNTGVNPQTSILALATLCGRRVMAA